MFDNSLKLTCKLEGKDKNCLKQCLPFLFNFQVNFNELAIIYPTVLFPPNIYIANFVFCLLIFLYIYGFIEYYAEY